MAGRLRRLEILRGGAIGLMPALSRWVIQQAAQILVSFAAAGCKVRVSVNVTAEDLNDPSCRSSSVRPATPGEWNRRACVLKSPRGARVQRRGFGAYPRSPS
jgi:hypothetical protein